MRDLKKTFEQVISPKAGIIAREGACKFSIKAEG